MKVRDGAYTLTRENMSFEKPNVWVEDAISLETGALYQARYIRRIFQEEPYMSLEFLSILPKY